MFFLLQPMYLGITALAGAAAYVKMKRDKEKANTATMNGERQIVYETALSKVKDPDKLYTLANTFEGEGLIEQATMLRKRAVLRALPEEIKEKRKEIFRTGMASKNKDGVLKLASAFEGEGATGAAESLRLYANGLT